ncbi:hypothetical protein AB0M64_03770 [Streptomyces sp. NPDC051771]|uniref:hypothetical protein n=1 Tax=Streptomyces sp. NPDC051771 TaxID=3154847 RepID=UPI00342E3E30
MAKDPEADTSCLDPGSDRKNDNLEYLLKERDWKLVDTHEGRGNIPPGDALMSARRRTPRTTRRPASPLRRTGMPSRTASSRTTSIGCRCWGGRRQGHPLFS